MSRDVPLSPHQHVTSDLTKMLADRDWAPESEEDYSALNDAVLFMFDASAHVEKPLSIQDLLDELIAKTRPAALPETSYSIEHRLAANNLARMLSTRGWDVESEEDDSALHALVRYIFDTTASFEKPSNIEDLLSEFMLKTRLPKQSYSIDDQLAAKLAERNWVPVTAADVAALDALSREIFETRIFVEPVLSFEAMLTQFIAKNTPPAAE
jgi:hypothetical protein